MTDTPVPTPFTLHGHGLFYVTRDGSQLVELTRRDGFLEVLGRPEADVLAALLAYALENQIAPGVPMAYALRQAADDMTEEHR